MAEPRIQYAKTQDGVSIAFWTMGEGEPALVELNRAPFTHIELEWQYPAYRQFYERVAQTRQLVRLDWRGTGLSERTVSDYSMNARMLDVDSVVDRLGLETFALYGVDIASLAAITYAAHQRERVSHLILLDGFTSGLEFSRLPKVKGLTALLDTDWEMYTETVANVGYGWDAGEPARRLAEFLRQCTTQEVAKAYFEADSKVDVTNILSKVRAPTLLLHRRHVPFPPVDSARAIASAIADSRLMVLEGSWLQSGDEQARAIEEFLTGKEPSPSMPQVAADMYTILFTDMQSSTALAQQLGDAAAQKVRRAHNDIVRAALAANAGSEIKHTGDGIMASFATASSALDCAIAIQRGVAAHKEEHPDSPLGLYVGLNAGEPIAEEGDLFGTSINLAARICDHAEPNQILAADVVRQLAAGKDFLFADLGETELRGFEDPVKLWELRWQEQG